MVNARNLSELEIGDCFVQVNHNGKKFDGFPQYMRVELLKTKTKSLKKIAAVVISDTDKRTVGKVEFFDGNTKVWVFVATVGVSWQATLDKHSK